MKVVIAIDSLKDSLTSYEAGFAAAAGVRKAYSDIPVDIEIKPLADGGEGTVEALVTGMDGEYRAVTARDPIGRDIECKYGYLARTNTAIIEMAAAGGIGLVHGAERNPMRTSTYGVGQMIRRAMDDGVRRFIIGIGGSATNDCGLGMLAALGYRFLDAQEREVWCGGEALRDVACVRDDQVPEALTECDFKIACDVTNPLCGDNGCSAVYGPQKGADPEMVKLLDDYCRNFADVTAKAFGTDNRDTPGAGAAGGLGFAFLSYLNGTLEPGIDIVLEEVRMEEALKDADYLVTGEGRLDAQTAMGKGPAGIAMMAKKYGVKVVGLAGSYTEDAVQCNAKGIDAYFTIVPGVMDLETAMNREVAQNNMTNTAEQVFRLIRAVTE